MEINHGFSVQEFVQQYGSVIHRRTMAGNHSKDDVRLNGKVTLGHLGAGNLDQPPCLCQGDPQDCLFFGYPLERHAHVLGTSPIAPHATPNLAACSYILPARYWAHPEALEMNDKLRMASGLKNANQPLRGTLTDMALATSRLEFSEPTTTNHGYCAVSPFFGIPLPLSPLLARFGASTTILVQNCPTTEAQFLEPLGRTAGSAWIDRIWDFRKSDRTLASLWIHLVSVGLKGLAWKALRVSPGCSGCCLRMFRAGWAMCSTPLAMSAKSKRPPPSKSFQNGAGGGGSSQ